jgi:hypothetical protein
MADPDDVMAGREDVIVGNYKDWTISLGRYNKQFYAERDGEGDRIDGDSYRDVKERIDKHETVTKRAARRKLSLAIIGSDGVARTATGIHGNSRNLSVTPKKEHSYKAVDFYADLPWVRPLIARRLALKKRVEAIKEALEPASMLDGASGYGRVESEQLMSKLLDEVKAAYDKAVKAKPPANLDELLK